VAQHVSARVLLGGQGLRHPALKLPAQAEQQARREMVQAIDDVPGLDPFAARGVRRGDEPQREQIRLEPRRFGARQRLERALPLLQRRQLGAVVVGQRDQGSERSGEPADGRELRLRAVDLFEVRGGLVAHESGWYGDGWLIERLTAADRSNLPPELPFGATWDEES